MNLKNLVLLTFIFVAVVNPLRAKEDQPSSNVTKELGTHGGH